MTDIDVKKLIIKHANDLQDANEIDSHAILLKLQDTVSHTLDNYPKFNIEMPEEKNQKFTPKPSIFDMWRNAIHPTFPTFHEALEYSKENDIKYIVESSFVEGEEVGSRIIDLTLEEEVIDFDEAAYHKEKDPVKKAELLKKITAKADALKKSEPRIPVKGDWRQNPKNPNRD